ncbi:hypothetical protein ACFYUY_01680 [Kitasatospora sp. NPDC004745]|uniref:hypothetical protein n=1 Tax=Kitasatospora sp. NPDC004745 TaxID=3364019 RepID=UPI00367F3C9D
MSAHRIIVIRCNSGLRCGAEISTPFGTSRAADVRAYTRPHGWHQRPGGRDICPDCWAAGHR